MKQSTKMKAAFVSANVSNLREVLKNLINVLGESQNRPPFGEADGSINENSWYELRSACHVLEDFISKAERLRSL